jgi:hypothetical protein
MRKAIPAKPKSQNKIGAHGPFESGNPGML